MAVYTEVSLDEASTFLTSLKLGNLQTMEGCSGGIENTNYFVTTDQAPYVLTLFERLSAEQLPFYLRLMKHLAFHGIPVPDPAANRDGDVLHSLNGKPAAVVNRLKGKSELAPGVEHCRQVGATLARMHLVGRDFTAVAPNQLWVTDLTYVPTWAGVAYVCFIIDAYSRMIVGWRAAPTMRTETVLDAIEMARWSRGMNLEGLRCHSDAGSQFTSIRYGERLAEIGATPSIGTVGDSYDNALAETVNGYYKAELIRGPARQRPWKTVEDVELATRGWDHWHNTQRLHGYLVDVQPFECEQVFYADQTDHHQVVGIQ